MSRFPAGNAALAAPQPTFAPAYDPDLVVARLEDAGRALLALPGTGLRTLPTGTPEVVREATEAYGYTDITIRPARPSAAAITLMDEALLWVLHIPLDRPATGAAERWSLHGGAVLRSIVGARMLVSPTTDRHLFSWRRLGKVVNADYKSVQAWHARAIGTIADALNRRAYEAEIRGWSNSSRIG